MSSTAKTNETTQTISLSQRIIAATVGGTLGLFLLLGVGFANPDLIHNAAHDSRHAGTFPCH